MKIKELIRCARKTLTAAEHRPPIKMSFRCYIHTVYFALTCPSLLLKRSFYAGQRCMLSFIDSVAEHDDTTPEENENAAKLNQCGEDLEAEVERLKAKMRANKN